MPNSTTVKINTHLSHSSLILGNTINHWPSFSFLNNFSLKVFLETLNFSLKTISKCRSRTKIELYQFNTYLSYKHLLHISCACIQFTKKNQTLLVSWGTQVLKSLYYYDTAFFKASLKTLINMLLPPCLALTT